MSSNETKENLEVTAEKKARQKGSAVVLALFVLAMVGAFVALTLTRTSSEAAATGNEAAEARTFYAAQGSLEMMTRNFNKIFETKLTPTTNDLNKVRDGDNVPGLSTATGGQFTFLHELDQTSVSRSETLSGGPYSGLFALRDNWRLRTTATDTNTRTQVELTRNILNNRIPIFQFGVFYEDDLELFRPPLFSFGGRVHSNRHFFISPGAEGVYFDSRVTAHGHIITQTWRNGYSGDSANNQTWIKNASGVNRQLLPTEGSVLNGTPNIFASDPDLPSSRRNTSFASQTAKFDGNLRAEVPELKLPLKVAGSPDLSEMIRRGKAVATTTDGGDLVNNAGVLEAVTSATVDGDIMKAERFANKTGIRVSLADSKAKLPGCALNTGAAVSTPCGVRLDGHLDGSGSDPVAVPFPFPSSTPATTVTETWSRGYRPKPMKVTSSATSFNYQSTRVNGERLHTGGTRQVWIKIETVVTDDTTGNILTKEITEDILALGMTYGPPSAMNVSGYGGCSDSDNGSATSPSFNLTTTNPQSPSSCPDSRSILRIQRFAIPGVQITEDAQNAISFASSLNYIKRFSNVTQSKIDNGCPSGNGSGTTCKNDTTASSDAAHSWTGTNRENWGHLKFAGWGSGTSDDQAVVPFPVELFDTREGLYFDDKSTSYYSNSNFDSFRKVSWAGAMSMLDIDVANLRRFLRGDFNGLFPTDTPFATAKGSSLVNTDIPDLNGWVLYVSDRRGDFDFDGKYDMEDVYGASPGNDGSMQKGEDLDPPGTFGFGVLNADYSNDEAPRYREAEYVDRVAVIDHPFYRRGVRLINGTVVPGIYDSGTAANTKGFTVSSENGVYVLGNYNATHVTSVPSTGNTPYDNFRPHNTATHIPASIVADGVTILSNVWQDAESFRSPWDKTTYRQADDTTIRFAMIAGDTIASKEATPHQGGISPRLNGGVHNFKRFLERWSGDNLNYVGSLINLYNSHNNNGAFKCCNTVYDPPRRNWVFDSTFLDPTRLPPGSPFFQYIQTTGFERTNN